MLKKYSIYIKKLFQLIDFQLYFKATAIITICAIIVFVIASFYSLKDKILFSNTEAIEAGSLSNGENSLVAQNAESAYDTDNNKSINRGPQEVLIAVDPGHGGRDEGTRYGDLKEKDVNLDISLKLAELIKNKGYKYLLTRDKDVALDEVLSKDLEKRWQLANNRGATLFISIHNNYLENDSTYKGAETLYCPPIYRQYDTMDGEKFAKIVQKELVSTLGMADNGIISRPNLAVLHNTKMPAVIAEIGYFSNASDRAKLASTEFREKAAKALFTAIEKALEEMKVYSEDGKWMVK